MNAHYIRDLVSNQLEVADPVEHHAYQLGRVYVSEFVLRLVRGRPDGRLLRRRGSDHVPGTAARGARQPGPLRSGASARPALGDGRAGLSAALLGDP